MTSNPGMSALAMISSGTKQADTPTPRLVRAAHEFEAAMMKELLAPIESGQGAFTDDSAGSCAALTSFAGEALGKAISERGGFGIANSIIHQITSRSNHSGKTLVPRAENGNLVFSPLK